MDPVTTVTHRMTVRLLVTHTYALPLRLDLRYEPTDPYTVRALFCLGTHELAEWILGRDLLAHGLTGPAGHGNIRIRPTTGPGGHTLHIALGPPPDTALLEAPAHDIKTFLKDTQALVPHGTESAHIDWETELTNLLTTS
ncbi:SsgA family sporulation/cell division regulator [Streptomyces adustus]|uniref:SsgA family sporulation/cell division regulator n=2 Tax=Streptomyces adustus TaxID=1609272 RepID=A0A5N8VWF5_9ACTN|nr:SsgA family sporulation/cell division regulator [Streptomyces adustus]